MSAPWALLVALSCGTPTPSTVTTAPEGAEPPDARRCQPPPEPGEGCYLPVPGGRFVRGAQAQRPDGVAWDPDAAPEEGPPHEVTLDPYWIQREEVTVRTYQRCVEDGACDPDAPRRGGAGTWRGVDDAASRDYPLVGIDHPTAVRVCRYLGGRLPTEAEWELAARGPTPRRWPWGDTPACGVTLERFTPSGAQRGTTQMEPPCHHPGPRRLREITGASPFGLLGAAGSAWEWTEDGWDPGAYARAAPHDPRGPADAPLRVLRGGSWMSEDPVDLRTTVRQPAPPTPAPIDAGVRCVWGTR